MFWAKEDRQCGSVRHGVRRPQNQASKKGKPKPTSQQASKRKQSKKDRKEQIEKEKQEQRRFWERKEQKAIQKVQGCWVPLVYMNGASVRGALQEATRKRCLASSNKCLTSSNNVRY